MSERQIYASVNLKRLLPEVPRFFPSFESVLGEILQNAYRSGATEVVVEYDAAHNSLSIQDNGPGLDVPERLLVVGDAGWDESLVIDPAGMGAFAALRPEYVRRVVYESHGRWNWQLTVSPDLLHGGPAVLRDLPANGAHGLSVRLDLADSLAQSQFDYLLQQARAFYPFSLCYRDGSGEERTIAPDPQWQTQLALDLPVGRVEWSTDRRSYRFSHDHKAIWEYRPIDSDTLHKALVRAAEAHPLARLAKALLHYSLRWFIDPGCGVRPKLPDRHDILNDQALVQAAGVILDALVERVLQLGREISPSWPDCFELNDIAPRLPLPEQHAWLGRADLVAKELPVPLGWKRVDYLVPADTSWYAMDEGDGAYLDCDTYRKILFDRHAATAASDILNLTLNLQGIHTACESEASDPKVVISGFRGDPERSPYVAFADRIHVEGHGDLPWLLIPDAPDALPWLGVLEASAYDGQVVVVAGSVQAFVRTLQQDPTFVNMIGLVAMRENFPDSWCGWQDGEPFFDEAEALATITLQVTETFAPDLLAPRQRYYSLTRPAEALQLSQERLRDAVRHLRRHASCHKDLWALLPLGLAFGARGLLHLASTWLEGHQRRLAKRAHLSTDAT